MKKRFFFTLVSLSLSLTACSNLGPRTIEVGRADYNTVLRNTADQQLLQNLVRLRYLERPYFLEVASVTTQFTFGMNAGTDLGLGSAVVDGETQVSAQGSYQETPTVAYEPLQGKEFVQRMLAPIPLKSLVMLSQSGWSIERIMRVAIQRTNDIGNAVTASGPTPVKQPEYEQFLQLAKALRTLQQNDQLTISGKTQNDAEISLIITHGGEKTPAFKTVVNLLQLAPNTTSFVLAEGLWQGKKRAIDVQTRSLNGMLYYLSHGVEVPEEHRQKKVVRITKDKSGKSFNWFDLTGSLIRIRSSKALPENAAIAVRHRHYWFWISDDDLESKSTFSLLTQILALQAVGDRKVRPILTLPVGN